MIKVGHDVGRDLEKSWAQVPVSMPYGRLHRAACMSSAGLLLTTLHHQPARQTADLGLISAPVCILGAAHSSSEAWRTL